VKKVLLPRGKNEVRSAIYTFEDAILKLRHGLYPRQPEHVVGSETAGPTPRRRVNYSTSRRDFFRFRLRASACLARSFSPGFK
jgi:hypothetical protein